jgi:hypothetical protein
MALECTLQALLLLQQQLLCLGALAFGIGTSEVEHVLATQTLLMKKARNMRIAVDGNSKSSNATRHGVSVSECSPGVPHVRPIC